MKILLKLFAIWGEISSSNLSIRIKNVNNAPSYDEYESFLYLTIQISHYEYILLRLIQCLFLLNSCISFQVCNIFPVLIDYCPGNHNTLYKNFTCLQNYLLTKIKEHEKSLDVTNPRDFIDYLLIKEMKVNC